MKRNVIALLLIISAVFCIYGQSTSPVDLVLLLDTSSAMSSSFDKVNDYITGAFLSEFLRIGDTFHLITFSGASKLDAARRINSRGDVETIIGRMLLQYPVENGSNPAAAINFTEQYISALPVRQKKVVMISVSDAAAAANAAKPGFSSKNATLDFVSVTPGQALANLPSSGRPRPAGSAAQTAAAPVSPARPVSPVAPAPPAPAPQTAAPASQAPAPQTAAPAPVVPAPAPVTTAPLQSTVPSDTSPAQTSAASSPQVPAQRAESTAQEPPRQPEPQPNLKDEGPDTQTPSTEIANGASEKKPADSGKSSGTAKASVKPEKIKKADSSLDFSFLLIIGLIILALLILGLIIFFVLRRLGSSPGRVMAEAAKGARAGEKAPASAAHPAASKPVTKPPEQYAAKSPAQSAVKSPAQNTAKPPAQFADHSKDLASYAAAQSRQRTSPYSDRHKKTDIAPAQINPAGPLLLNLFVEDQNTAIGKRNIHSLKSGYSLTVGGGKSDFLIFLVPIPANIGEIKRNGTECTFIPKKPKYFPDLGSSELKDCVNKTIRIISDRNYEMRFRFEMYEDPLIALNRLLHSVKVPG
ncbi:MAG: VWA domain-containing protein [Treponema sp.]|jgi:hypothetical protein|nr:VWA domain-containing protein [Treponema sp.]